MSDDKRDIRREWFDMHRCIVSDTQMISCTASFGALDGEPVAGWNVIPITAAEVRGGRGVPRLDDNGTWWQPPPEDDE